MKPLSDMLYRHGYPVHVIAGLGYNTRQVPVMAYLVHRFVVTSGIQRAVVIAHSKGGLIGKYVLAHYNEDDRIRHLIAINTPFSGSVYADFAPVGHVRIFSRRDATITRLRMNEIVNSRITSLYSKFDPTIPHSSYLEGATNLTLDTIGHFHVVSSKRLHAMVLDVLERVEASADD
jgi:pimeloyl-ACP methyl ester carboxylesterase